MLNGLHMDRNQICYYFSLLQTDVQQMPHQFTLHFLMSSKNIYNTCIEQRIEDSLDLHSSSLGSISE